ncbi:MAG TPA: hypothetical protein VK179_14865 [Bacteroidales bacterium]|nr:hypothetical protein [Bacteroidales bacterium]
MDVKTYNRQQLRIFIESDEFRHLDNIPITTHRALSQIVNPRCDDEDVLLTAVYREHRLIGYLGVLPDRIFYNNSGYKCGWLSCFWVDENSRNEPVAATLLLKIMEAWDYRILITNFVPNLAALYLRSGMFLPPLTMTGIRGYLRSNLAEILPPKNQWFSKIAFFLRFTDHIINAVTDIRFYRIGRMVTGYSTPEQLDEKDEQFICEQNIHSLTRRGAAELQWIINHPWVKESKPNEESRRYYFSSVSMKFRYRLIKISKNEEVSAFALICIRNQHLTVPYVFSISGYNELADILFNLMVKEKLGRITVFHPDLVKAFTERRFSFLLKKKIQKPYIFSKRLKDVAELKFNDGDGDCAFY